MQIRSGCGVRKILFWIAAFAVLIVTPATAQWHDESPCNRTYNDGFANKQGSGPNGSFNISFSFNAHYEVADLDKVKNSLVQASVFMMNDYAMVKDYSMRFNGADYRDRAAQGLNFVAYYDIYSSDDGYTIYVCLHGWGADHLFRAKGGTYSDIERALRSALHEVVDRLNNGWVCGE